LWKKYVLSLDLKLDSESQRINGSGNEFQTVGAAKGSIRKDRSGERLVQ